MCQPISGFSPVVVLSRHSGCISLRIYKPTATGCAAERMERKKRSEFERFGSGAGYDFVPLAMESYGRLGREASRFLSDLGDIAASDGRLRKAAFVRSVRQELSCVAAVEACTSTLRSP